MTLGTQLEENVFVHWAWEEGKFILGSTLFPKTLESLQGRLEIQPLYLLASQRNVLLM